MWLPGSYRAQLGERVRICLLGLDSTPSGETGSTWTLKIRRDVDGFYWDDTSQTFASASATVAMTETSSANLPGFYHYDFLPPTTNCGYTVSAITNDADVVDKEYGGHLYVGGWLDSVDVSLSSLASDADMTELLKKFGNTNLDIEFRRVVSLLDQVLGAIRGKMR